MRWFARAVMAAALGLLFGAVWRLARRSGPVGRLMRAEAVSGYLFAAPWVIGFLVFTIGPILVSVVLFVFFTQRDFIQGSR